MAALKKRGRQWERLRFRRHAKLRRAQAGLLHQDLSVAKLRPLVHGWRRSSARVLAARVVAFLAHDASSYITGQIWAVNGGLDM